MYDYPFAPLSQEFDISPTILFQFFPNWLVDEETEDHFEGKERMGNMILKTMTDLLVESLTEVDKKKTAISCGSSIPGMAIYQLMVDIYKFPK